MAKKKNDDRRVLLIRYRIKENNKVEFIDPCCDEIPVLLFGEIMKAISKVEDDWNERMDKAYDKRGNG